MKNVILGNKGFVSSSLKTDLEKKKIKAYFIGKDKINFIKKNSVIKCKKLLTKIGKINLVIISAISPARNLSDYQNNLIIINNIIKSINKNQINKIIYISSDAVYSDTKKKINEKSKTVPTSIHGLMHLHREHLLRLFFKDKLIIVRPTLLFGSVDPHNSYGPNKFIREAKKGKNIFLFGKGEEKRDHLYVHDLADIIIRIVINKKIKNGIFNAVSGRVLSFYKIAKIVQNKYPKIKILETKRTGPMPHLGLRQFSNLKIKKCLNKKKFSYIENKIELY
jgi:UDP-glucose 4-epimerase